MARRWPLLFTALLLCGCQPREGEPRDSALPGDAEPASFVDEDHDGVSPELGDCDDHDAEVSRGQDERCNGVDDNCDGRADEGFPDTDGDGVADCVETEDCDGLDNDGDGQVDEGFDQDDDGDGVPDCAAEERCDGLDNDGDGQVDEGFDDDGDGASPCGAEADCDDADPAVHPGAAERSQTEVDEDCDGLIDEGDWLPGDLVITEVMANPAMVADPFGEWIELRNASDRAVYLDGLILSTSLYEYALFEDSRFVIAPGDRVILGSDPDLSRNGGVDLDGVIPGLSLQNEDDLLRLTADGLTLDAISWTGTTPGASTALDELLLDATSNDDPGAWCPSGEAWGWNTDDGSPGEENWPCPALDHDGDGYSGDQGDCDDRDPAFSPGAEEIWYDGLDQDCDGWSDDDADKDGFDAATAGGNDCDDASPRTYPGADEIWYDGVDEDCDRWSDYDLDHDGYDLDTYGGQDCDDEDVDINPDAWELCDPDDVDEDCDGLADDRDIVAAFKVAWYWDGDHDGFGTAATTATACDPPFGFTDSSTDCDDGNPAIFPGAAEIWYDGVDQDCAGDDDYDADHDGERALGYGGTDCDDSEALTDASGPEVLDDGADNNCDGVIDPISVSVTLGGTESYGHFGGSVSGAGDVDGDGVLDLIIGADGADTAGLSSGTAWLFTELSGAALSSSEATAELLGGASGDRAGAVVAGVGDLDRDGYEDVAVGANGDDTSASAAGALYLVHGPVTGTVSLPAVGLALLGAGAGDYVGDAAAGVGDLDGDGWIDLLAAAPFSSVPGTRAGAIYLVNGPVTADLSLSLADATWTGEAKGDYAGSQVRGGGDLNGDGVLDLLAGAPYNATTDTQAGAVYALLGPASAGGSLADAELRLLGEQLYDQLGWEQAPITDADGDGYGDLLVGAANSETGTAVSIGQAWLFYGPLSGDHLVTDADLVVAGAQGFEGLGSTLDLVDLNADGQADLLLGASGHDEAESNMGALYLVLGGERGSLTVEDADAVLLGRSKYAALGGDAAGVGDLDGDGLEEALVGAYSASTWVTYGGDAYLLTGSAW